ncbi:MAG: thioesterase family protein [Myxococcota bacterium]|jgi:prolycopene isomerase|nr:thioesterase family protein [Myxococcota bacterium]
MPTSSNANPAAAPVLPSYDVAIVGAGLGGLVAGLELGRHGLKVAIFEQHRVAGGYAHGFKRGGYDFDVSLHHMGGLEPGHMMHGVLGSLGVMDKLRPRRRDSLLTCDFPGQRLVLPNGQAEILAELCRLFPAEAGGLRALFTYLITLKWHVVGPWVDPDFSVPLEDRLAPLHWNDTFLDVVNKFVSDPKLLAVLGQFWMSIGLPPSQATATFSTCVFGGYFLEGAFELEGGGSALVAAMLERLTELGGACFVRTSVERIIVENGMATGVLLSGNRFVAARTVISSANPYQTFFDLIPGEEVSKVFRYRLGLMKPSLSFLAMYVGLDCLPSELGVPMGSYIRNFGYDIDTAFERALSCALSETDFGVTNYEGTVTCGAPAGCGVLSFAELTPPGDWLSVSKEDYAQRKQAVLERLVDKYDATFPGLEAHAKVLELGTPRTMARYTRNHLGAVYGLAQTVDQSNGKRLRNRAPVSGLYLTGAWTWAGGGYEGSMMTGVQCAAAVLEDVGAKRSVDKIRAVPAAFDALEGARVHEVRKAIRPALSDRGDEAQTHPFRMAVHVYGEDVDPRNVTGTSAYLRFIDRGRQEAIETLCERLGQKNWLGQYTVNVYRITAHYLKDSQASEWLEVRTGIRRISTHRAAFDQRVVRPDTGELLVDATVEVAFLDATRDLVPVPEGFAAEHEVAAEGAPSRIPPVPFGKDDHFAFRDPFRVYYEDTDAQGITYHVSYVRFCTRALFDVVQNVWFKQSVPEWMGLNRVAITRLDARFLNSSGLGDRMEVRTGGRLADADHVFVDQRVVNVATGQVSVDVALEVVFLDSSGRVAPVPPQVAEFLASI